jgi:hypothetical protein
MTDDGPIFIPAEQKPEPRVDHCQFCCHYGKVTARGLCHRCSRKQAIRDRFPLPPRPRRPRRPSHLARERFVDCLVEERVRQLTDPRVKLMARHLLHDRLGRLVEQMFPPPGSAGNANR